MPLIAHGVLLLALIVGSYSFAENNFTQPFRCSANLFQCHSGKCISQVWRCDSDRDCPDGDDEQGCANRSCESQQTRCDSGKCIPTNWFCDKEIDCNDSSDEKMCSTRVCEEGLFQCNNSKCVLNRWKCDAHDDCGDNSDEDNCPALPEVTCRSDEFKCASGDLCVSKLFLCDNENDCDDASDEDDCGHSVPPSCGDHMFSCSAENHCIPLEWLCDGNSDCSNGNDEKDCHNVTTPIVSPEEVCNKGFSKCGSGECIRSKWLCDGEKDCVDGNDEKDCQYLSCGLNMFACGSADKCIDLSKKCDGTADCDDGSDERTCGSHACVGNHFKCFDGKCISVDKVCDHHNDCADGGDELSCFVNECIDHTAHCNQNCTDLKIGYKCSCMPGFALSSDGLTCFDLDECSVYGLCHQKCINVKGYYKCNCADGYLLEPDRKSCRALGEPSWLYLANYKEIRKLSLDGHHYEVSSTGLRGVVSIDFHVKNNRIFWTDVVDKTIYHAHLDSIETPAVILRDIHTVDGLAVDWVTDKLYWTDAFYQTIEVSTIDGNHRMELVDVGLSKPRAIVLDPINGHIFWSDWGETPAIERISMDGKIQTRRVLVNSNIMWPNGLTLDLAQQKLYWMDAKLKRIEVADFDGSNRKVIKRMVTNHPYALDNFEDKLFFTDWSYDGINQFSKFGVSRLQTIRIGLYSPRDIKVFHRSKQPTSENPCRSNNNGCSHLCLLANYGAARLAVCKCPPGMRLLGGKKCAGTPITRQLPSARPSITSPFTKTDRLSTNETPKPPITHDPSAVNVNGTKVKGKDHSISGSFIAIGLPIVAGILFIIILVVCLRKRSSSKSQVMYYKDMSTTPLEEDFDIDSEHLDDRAKIID